jgi:hypothetical protein
MDPAGRAYPAARCGMAVGITVVTIEASSASY